MSPALWLILLAGVLAQTDAANVPQTADLGLDRVQDRTFLEEADIAGYYGLLEKARQTDLGNIASSAQTFLDKRRPLSQKYGKVTKEKFPLFADLLSEPEAYRGQPVTLRGHSQEIKRYAAEENPYGITTLYECSLFTDDSQSHPTTIIFTEAPADLPLGEKIVDQVVATGYFLKLRAYHARDEKTRVAPLVLARSITWKRDSVRSSWISPLVQNSIYVGLGLVVLAWIGVRWLAKPSRRTVESDLNLSDVTVRE